MLSRGSRGIADGYTLLVGVSDARQITDVFTGDPPAVPRARGAREGEVGVRDTEGVRDAQSDAVGGKGHWGGGSGRALSKKRELLLGHHHKAKGRSPGSGPSHVASDGELHLRRHRRRSAAVGAINLVWIMWVNDPAPPASRAIPATRDTND